jgi:hypothetical protein
MTAILFTALPKDHVDAIRHGEPDSNGQVPERMIASADLPCRACLGLIKGGDSALLISYRPFRHVQPYAETGPIFIHAEDCGSYDSAQVPPPMLNSSDYIVRGYDAGDRIVYGTGAVTPTAEIVSRAQELLERPDIAYVHVRSARNNCFQCRIDRA